MSEQLSPPDPVRLAEALEVYPEMHGFPGYEYEECGIVEDAARFLLDLLTTGPDYEAAAEALMAKVREHPIPAPNFGGTAEPAMYWGVSPAEVARATVDAALGLSDKETE